MPRRRLIILCWVATLTAVRGQDLVIPDGTRLQQDPALVRVWADRLSESDRQTRAAAIETLVEAGAKSLPLLKRFLRSADQDLLGQTFDLLHRLGPVSIPTLTEMLKHPEKRMRLAAVDVLIDLAPDTESVQPALCTLLGDPSPEVARDGARALGALRARAAPSVPHLIKALEHQDEILRLYSAEALASIGPAAAPATKALIRSLRDTTAGVRWAAAEALAAMGPAAESAVPDLIAALRDEYLYVRICAAGALGSIGSKAQGAVDALKAAAKDPALRSEANWALSQITGKPHQQESPTPEESPAVEMKRTVPKDVWPMMGGVPTRNAAVTNAKVPLDWDPQTNRNIVWSAALGDETFGGPVVADGVIYIGTDNCRFMNRHCQDECGTLMAFRAKDGKFLWQDVALHVKRGLQGFLLPSTSSTPYAEGERLYYVTAQCQLRCLDTRGFLDNENDGVFQDEPFRDSTAADIIWEVDLCGRFGVFAHEACNSAVLPVGDLIVVCTSNGMNEGHTRVPSPRAPSLIAVYKRSGKVAWKAVVPGSKILHGQWCSPSAADVNGHVQVLFGGGDGWLRAYDAASGRERWRFDGNPKDAKWRPRPGVLSRNAIIASPVYQDGRVYLAMGQDPAHGNGKSFIYAISPNGQGDVTERRRLWTTTTVGRVVGTPIVDKDLLYVGDLGGVLHCLDATSGNAIWQHKTGGAIWGCLLLVGDRLYVGNEDGLMTVLQAGKAKKVLAKIEMDDPLYAGPAVAEDVLYLATFTRLYAITSKP